MLGDLGNVRGFKDSETAILRYDRTGRLTAQAGFSHKFYRLGLHPLAHELIAMSADCTLYAYDDDLRLLWRTTLADTSQIQTLGRRFPAMDDEWLKNHIRCVAFARDRSRYLLPRSTSPGVSTGRGRLSGHSSCRCTTVGPAGGLRQV
jgi:hypothetical protein